MYNYICAALLLHYRDGISSEIFSVKNPPNQRVQHFLEDWFRNNLINSPIMIVRRTNTMPEVGCYGESAMNQDGYRKLREDCEKLLEETPDSNIIQVLMRRLKRKAKPNPEQEYRNCLETLLEKLKSEEDRINWEKDEVVFMLIDYSFAL